MKKRIASFASTLLTLSLLLKKLSLAVLILAMFLLGIGGCNSCFRAELHDYIFQIIYDGNGHNYGSDSNGFGDRWSTTSTYVETVRGQVDLARTGYDFMGWSIDPLSTTSQYVEGDTIILQWAINPSIILYAVWIPNMA
ncbi:MAG: InlB B-repeat-containing protein [Dehalococcoidia bacterium]|nr:InlB B-repeat-containing protein [Dehalococcoidia bacterium]